MPFSSTWPRARQYLVLLGALLLLPLAVLLGTPPAHAAATSLTGSVYDSLGDPLDQVTVRAYPAADPATPVASTVTDVDGGYALTLDTGAYRLQYSKTGYTSTWYGDEPSGTVIEIADGVVLVEGEPVEEGLLDDATLVATAQHQVSGQVTTTAGQPLAGITVALYSDAEDAEPVISATTNGSGAFTLSTVAGLYFLRVSDPSGTYVDRWYGVGEPEELRVDGALQLGAIPLTAGSATTEHPIAGAVVDALGVGIGGVTVTATGTGSTSGTITTVSDATEDEAGRYSVAVLPGTYRLSFTRTGFLTTTYASTVTVAANGSLSVDPADEIVGNRLPDVTLASTPFGVSGRVVADATSTGLGGITVRAHGDDEDGPVTTTTSGTGDYSLSLPIGSYAVEAVDLDDVAPQYVSAWLGGSAEATLEVAQHGVLSIDDVPITALPTIRLTQASTETSYPVFGTVDDANGDAVDGVTVTASPVAGTNPLGATATATTGTVESGRFDLSLRAGTYEINVAGNAEFAAGFLPDDEDPPGRARVVVTASGTTVLGEPAIGGDLGSVTLRGTTPYPVTGSATDGTHGLAGITVEAISVDDGLTVATATTSGSGGFSFTGAGTGATSSHGLRIGTYKLRFTDRTSNAVRYRATWFGGEIPAEVKVGQGGVVTVDGIAAAITATMTAADADATYDVVGLVYDEEYEPLDGVDVTASPVAGTPATQRRTVQSGADATFGEAGVYRLSMSPGKYQLHFTKAGYQPQTLLNPDTDAPVVVSVGATGTITAPGLELIDGLIDDVQLLLVAARFATAPKLTGKVAVGSTVTATFGTLQGVSIDKDSVFVEWFLNGKPADDYSAGAWGQKFKVTAAAATRKLTFRVSIDDPDGLRAPSVFTSKAVPVPQAPSSVKASVKKGKLTVVVAVPTLAKPTGRLVVKAGRKSVATVTLKPGAKGKAVISLAKLKRGKHKLTVTYTGPSTIRSASTKLKYKK